MRSQIANTYDIGGGVALEPVYHWSGGTGCVEDQAQECADAILVQRCQILLGYAESDRTSLQSFSASNETFARKATCSKPAEAALGEILDNTFHVM